jgi:hypothetical protein
VVGSLDIVQRQMEQAYALYGINATRPERSVDSIQCISGAWSGASQGVVLATMSQVTYSHFARSDLSRLSQLTARACLPVLFDVVDAKRDPHDLVPEPY